MRRKIDLLVLLLVLIGGIFAVKNAQAIGDWWHAMRYDPPSEISKLADDAGMSSDGKKLFYRFSPQLVNQATLTEKCTAEKLGCTEGRSIYILQYTGQAEYNRAIVTAVHEMLHVAYSRLSPNEVRTVNSQLDTELHSYGAAEITEALKDYPKEDYYNEAHSFIGSQLDGISPGLEQHYKRYLSDRAMTVQAYRESPER